MVESSVLFSCCECFEFGREWDICCVFFPALATTDLIRQPILTPSQSSGISHVKLQKRNGTCWLQADRRVTVDDKSSANSSAGFSSVQMAPIQEGGVSSSSDVAEPLPNTCRGWQNIMRVRVH